MQLFLGHFSFITPLFFGLFLFGMRVPKRKYYWIKLISCYVVTLLFFALVMDKVVSFAIDSKLAEEWILSIRVSFAFLAYLFLFLSSFIIYKTNFFLLFYLVTCSYSAQHLSRTLVSIVELYIPDYNMYVDLLLCLLFWSLVFFTCYWIFEKKQKNIELTVSNEIQLLIGSIPITFSIFLNSFGFAELTTRYSKVIFDIFVLCTTFLSLFLEYLMTRGKDIEQENLKIKRMLKEQKEQYYFEKQLIDLVNIKAHDLKHQLNENDIYSKEVVDNTKKLIGDYDASFDTGSSALDIIITKKSRECNRHQIKLTCLVDGRKLSFIEEIDLYALFGNIIDNAIEASRKIEDKSKRLISLSAVKKEGFVMIHESNYFVGNLKMHNGIPMTTKHDTNYHGYGIKSIKMLCDKYDGNLKISTEDNIFNIDLIFPTSI